MHNGEPCVAFNQTTIGNQSLRPDLVALWPIIPWSSLWYNDTFQVMDNDDGSAPAFNSIYFMGTKPCSSGCSSVQPDLGIDQRSWDTGELNRSTPNIHTQPRDLLGGLRFTASTNGCWWGRWSFVRHWGISPFRAFQPPSTGDTSTGSRHYPSHAQFFHISDAGFHHDWALPHPILVHNPVLPRCSDAIDPTPCWVSCQGHRPGSIPPSVAGNDDGTGEETTRRIQGSVPGLR